MAVNDLCSVSGILKLLQSVLIFITLLVHRHGDNGYYLFFATTGLKLGNKDPNIDYENLGNSTLVSFMIINLVLILGYVLDGPEAIHASLLEMVDTSAGMTETEFYRNVTAALAMAGLCITVGALYLVDFIFGWVTRSRETDEYKNP